MSSTELPALLASAVGGLPARPAADLDPYLDAAETCVRRYGWSRTSPRDIAAEAGVNRTTIYRVLGAKDEVFRLVLARRVHRLIDQAIRIGIDARGQGARGAGVIVELTASSIEQLRADPTIAKLLDDEPDLIASFMRDQMPSVIERFTSVLGPLVGAAMDEGVLARRDPHLMTEWVVRIGLSALFAPPRADLRTFLAAGLRPLFELAEPA